jgi:hypothetical protein
MGLDYSRMSTSSGSARTSSSTGVRQSHLAFNFRDDDEEDLGFEPFAYEPPRSSAPDSNSRAAGRTAPERISADMFGAALTGSDYDEGDSGSLRGIQDLALAPGRTKEMPLSTVNVALGGRKGSTTVAGPNGKDWQLGKQLLGPIDKITETISRTPVVGPLLGSVGKLFEESGKVGPAIVNAGDLRRLKNLTGKPNDMLLRDADPEFLFGINNPLNLLARAFDINTTVGQFRAEMQKRGFTAEEYQRVIEEGESPDFLTRLQSDVKYGDRPSSSNALISLGQSVALDPTNIVLSGIGAKLAMAGLKPITSGIGLLPRMEKLGVAAKTAPDAINSAIAISQGSSKLATAAGVSHYIGTALKTAGKVNRVYTGASIANTAGVVALDAATDWLQDTDITPEPLVPLLNGLQDLSQQIRDNKPLSDGALWNFTSAMTFPLRDFIPGTKITGRLALRNIKGGDGAVAAFKPVLGKDWLPKVGGETGAAVFINFLDKQIAFKRLNPATGTMVKSLDSAAQRMVVLNRELDILVEDLRSKGAISNKERVQTFKDWFADQSGFKKTGVDQEWDPDRALTHWNQWISIQRQWGTAASARGEAVIGLEPHLTKENIDDIKSFIKAQREGDRVPIPVLRGIFERYPQLLGDKSAGATSLAEFGVPDAKAPTWDSIRRRLNAAKAKSPSADELTHELAEVERQAPEPMTVPKQPGGHRELDAETLRDVYGVETPPSRRQAFEDAIKAVEEGREAIDPDTGQPIVALTKEHAIRSLRQRLGREAVAEPSGARVPHPAETAPIRNAQDQARGADPEFNAQRDTEAIAATEELVDWKGSLISKSAREEYQRIEAALKESHPGYTLKVPPDLAYIMQKAEIETPQIASQILRMNGLAESLRYFGPFSGVGRALEFLFAPVPGSRMRENAEQAINNYALPRGATPEQIKAIIAELEEHAQRETMGKGPLQFSAPWEMAKPRAIERVAEKHLDPAVYATIKSDFGGFTRLVDRSFNRFVQKQHRAGQAGGAVTGRLGRALEGVYGHYQNSVGVPLRYIKSYYPLLRFAASPRYWAMNMAEASLLGGIKYGSGRADARAGIALMTHDASRRPQQFLDEAAQVASVDTGQPMTGRVLSGHVSRNFDGMTVESAVEFLDNLPKNSKEHADLVKNFGPNRGTWAEQLNQMLYNFDTIGVKRTVDEAAAAIFTPDQIREMAPILQRVYEINDGHLRAITNMYEGNPSRSNVERVLNSYFLYWPLSYQLKAGKWLWDVLTERAFGTKTNFGGAYALENLVETHKEMMATDENYQKMMEENESLWFAAGMFFPLSPFDVGVSLNRGVRYAGGELGLWAKYKQAQDPLSAAEAMMQLGPLYDISLLAQVWSEREKNSKPAKTRPQPYSGGTPSTTEPSLADALVGG